MLESDEEQINGL